MASVPNKLNPRREVKIERHNADELTPDQAAAIYDRDQVLWLKLPRAQRQCCAGFTASSLLEQFESSPEFFSRNWSVENSAQLDPASLTPLHVFGREMAPNAAFYVSSILQKNKAAQKAFLDLVPVKEHPLLEGARHDEQIWLFLGANPLAATGGSGKGRKRQRQECPPLAGRPEHVDDVDHDGMYNTHTHTYIHTHTRLVIVTKPFVLSFVPFFGYNVLHTHTHTHIRDLACAAERHENVVH
jgi:hypothetical protein